MTFLNQTEQIAACIGFILMWAAHLWYSLTSYIRLYRDQSKQMAETLEDRNSDQGQSMPGISVIIPACNVADQLARQLPLLLNQNYEPFEVIVIDLHSTDGTADLLERLEKQYEYLKHTFVPDSARYVSKHSLALTLGIKSARYEWVALTAADCIPAGGDWLKGFSRFLTPDKDLVFGYANYNPANTSRKESFVRLYRQLFLLPWCRKHPAYRITTNNMFYRKSCFLGQNDFASFCNLNDGAEEILANHHSNLSNTAVCLLPETYVFKDFPGKKACIQERVFDLETAGYLKRRLSFRFRFIAGLLIPWLFYMFLLLGLLIGIKAENWILVGICSVLTIALWGIKGRMFRRTSKAFQARQTCFLLSQFFELALPFWYLNAVLKHRFCDRRLFYKKYI